MALGDKIILMKQATYDADADGIADQTEGLKVVTSLPSGPTAGQTVVKDGKVYVAV
jgi:hypothetical protein